MTRMLAQEEKARLTASAAAAGRSDHCAAPPSVHPADPDRRISAMPEQIEAGGSGRSPWEPVAWLLEKARPQSRDPHRYLLVLRFALLNVVGFALLGAAYVQGLVDRGGVADRTYLSVLIFLGFLGGLGIC